MSRKKILICEDDAEIRQLLHIVLSKNNFEVVATEYVKQAEKEIAEKDIDLILLDLWLPDINGDELLIRLKNDHKKRNIPVILISADNKLKEIAEASGADDYLFKPFDIFELETKVKEALKQ